MSIHPSRIAKKRHALCTLHGSVKGSIFFQITPDQCDITYDLEVETVDSKEHAIHIHDFPGGHFDPEFTALHGPLSSSREEARKHHAGDLGNIIFDNRHIKGSIVSYAPGLYEGIYGKHIVIHTLSDKGTPDSSFGEMICHSIIVEYKTPSPFYFDLIIVGGGIAGLYTAYKMVLQHKGTKILILEATSKVGGLIYGPQRGNNKWECSPEGCESKWPVVIEQGPSVHLASHHRLEQLLQDFGIKSHPTPRLPVFSCNRNDFVDESEEFQKIIHGCHGMPCSPVRDISNFDDLEITGNSEIKDFLCKDLAAYENSTPKYVPQGYESIVHSISRFLTSHPNVEIRCNTCVSKVFPGIIATTSGEYLDCPKIVIAVPMKARQNIEFHNFISIPHPDYSIGKKSCRIYFKYKCDNPILNYLIRQGRRNILSKKNQIFKWAMVVSSDIILASYTDAEDADFMLQYTDATSRNQQIIREIDSCTGFENGSLGDNDFHVITGGMHGPDAYHVSKRCDRLLLSPSHGISFVGECVSAPELRAWIEGALESTDHVLLQKHQSFPTRLRL
jgi:Cu/Zn superoxide dismutase